MRIDLSNMSVLVTGASRGIGAAVARAMGKAGARVAIHYRDKGQEATALARQIGASAEVFQADLSNAAECSQRLTEPDDIAPFVVFLASGLADHSTGCTIDVNAGSYVH